MNNNKKRWAFSDEEVVVFVEFLDDEPFALVTAAGHRYDVEKWEGALYWSCCGGGIPQCYLEQAQHEYWAAPGIEVVTNMGDPADPELRRCLPEEYREESFVGWPNMYEGSVNYETGEVIL